jgi:hypothetical protein
LKPKSLANGLTNAFFSTELSAPLLAGVELTILLPQVWQMCLLAGTLNWHRGQRKYCIDPSLYCFHYNTGNQVRVPVLGCIAEDFSNILPAPNLPSIFTPLLFSQIGQPLQERSEQKSTRKNAFAAQAGYHCLMPQSNADKRLILTFPTLHQVLAAERALRERGDSSLRCRPTPTPPGLSESICGMAIEIFAKEEQEKAIEFLRSQKLEPSGCHLVG